MEASLDRRRAAAIAALCVFAILPLPRALAQRTAPGGGASAPRAGTSSRASQSGSRGVVRYPGGSSLRALRAGPAAREAAIGTSAGTSASSDGAEPTARAPVSRARSFWLPLTQNAAARRGVVSAVIRDMRRGSAALERAIDRRAGEPVWDTVIVGGGAYAAATAQGLASADPERRVLTVEPSASPAPTFGTPGAGLARATRQQLSGGVARNPGRVIIGGPVETSDLTSERLPDLDTLSDAATLALHTSGTDVLLRNHVERVERAPAGAAARYLVTVRNATTGARRQVFASNVVMANRAGPPRVALADASTNRLLQRGVDATERLLARAADDTDGPTSLGRAAGSAPRVMTVAQALELSRRSPGGSPDTTEAALVTAVVGFDDNALAVADGLSGAAPGGAALGAARLVWAVGNDAPPEPDAVRPEMFPGSPRLNAAIGAGATQLVRARVVGVRAVTERGRPRFALTYDHGFGRRSEGVVDRILVSSAGLESGPGDVLEAFAPRAAGRQSPIEHSSLARPVVVAARAVARQVADESIFFVGPSAVGIVPESEVGASGLTTALESNLPRTTTFASTVLAAEPRAGGDRARAIDVGALAWPAE